MFTVMNGDNPRKWNMHCIELTQVHLLSVILENESHMTLNMVGTFYKQYSIVHECYLQGCAYEYFKIHSLIQGNGSTVLSSFCG